MLNKMMKHNTWWIILCFFLLALKRGKFSVDDRIGWPYTFFYDEILFFMLS